MAIEDEKDLFSDTNTPYLPYPPQTSRPASPTAPQPASKGPQMQHNGQKEPPSMVKQNGHQEPQQQMQQNGHVNGVVDKKQESPFVDASEAVRKSAFAACVQDIKEKPPVSLSQGFSSSGGLKPGGLRSRLSQSSLATGTSDAPPGFAPGSTGTQSNLKSDKSAPGSKSNVSFMLPKLDLKTSESCNSLPGTPTSKTKEQQAPSVFQVLERYIQEVVEGFRELIRWCYYIVDKIKKGDPINIPLPRLVQTLLWTFTIINLFMVKLLRPKAWWLFVFVTQGMLLGLGMSYLYYRNKRRKAEICGVLGSNLGLKGLNFLLGGLPSWLSFQKKEKVQFLNRALEEVWPFYDRGLSKLIQAIAEEQFHNNLKVHKLPGVKDVGFKHFTFGDVPFRVDSIEVNGWHGSERALVMEIEMRWCGEANIALAIDLEPPLGKMCPGLEDITFSGTLRVVLQPLVDDIPGFGVAMVTFRKPPKFGYSMAFGQNVLGQQMGALITPWINGIIHNQLVNMLVWPQRLVVPIINTPQMEYEMERLSFHACGIMKITVIRAEKLPAADVVGSSDAFVELTTDGKHVVSTRFISDNLNPVWNETHYVLVHDPQREHMKVEVHDHDAISPMDILKLNFKEVLDAKELLGRCLVNVKPITDCSTKTRTPYENWYDLGKGDWDKVGGCGKGRGRLLLSSFYKPFSDFAPVPPDSVISGVLIFKLKYAHKLPRAIRAGETMTVNAEVRCGKQREIISTVTSADDHKWNNLNTVDFHGIKSNSECSVVIQDMTSGVEETVGTIDIKVQDVLQCRDVNPLSRRSDRPDDVEHEANFMTRAFKLKNLRGSPSHSCGWVTARFRFVPYF